MSRCIRYLPAGKPFGPRLRRGGWKAERRLMRIHPIPILVLLLAMLSSSAQAKADDGVGSVRGQVRDATGSPLPGAVVELRGQAVATAVTNDEGAFDFPGLAAGRYVVQVALINFTGASRSVDVTSGEAATV